MDNINNFITNYEEIGNSYVDPKFSEDLMKRESFQIPPFKKLKKKIKIEKKLSVMNKDSNEYKEKLESIKKIFYNYESEFKIYCDYFPKLKEIIKIPKIIKENNGRYAEDIKKRRKEKIKKYVGRKTLVEIPNTHYTKNNIWIIKAINLNRGMCIKVVNSFSQIKDIIQKFKHGVEYGFTGEGAEEKPKEENNQIKVEEEKNACHNFNDRIYYCDKIIIQKYIEKPLLYKGRKCDIRIWVLLTQSMKAYIFKEGHLKTCSIEFNLCSKNAFAHITNYSFQKYSHDFQKFEEGNEVPFYDFQKFIEEKYTYKQYNIKTDLIEQAKEIIEITMRSVKDKINKNGRNFQFEIFGYDFMLDEDFNLFLIEINTNPGLEESSPWIKIIVPRMLDDALRLTIDQLFETRYDFSLIDKKNLEPENFQTFLQNFKNSIDDKSLCEKEIRTNTNNLKDNKKYISPFPVPGYQLDDNLWDLVCDLNDKDPYEDKFNIKYYYNDKEQPFYALRNLFKKRRKSK